MTHGLYQAWSHARIFHLACSWSIARCLQLEVGSLCNCPTQLNTAEVTSKTRSQKEHGLCSCLCLQPSHCAVRKPRPYGEATWMWPSQQPQHDSQHQPADAGMNQTSDDSNLRSLSVSAKLQTLQSRYKPSPIFSV